MDDAWRPGFVLHPAAVKKLGSLVSSQGDTDASQVVGRATEITVLLGGCEVRP